MSYPFDPDWVIKPGETLREWMEERKLSPRLMSTICGRIPPETIEGILDGTVEITPGIADWLQLGTDIPARLWLNLERIYRAGLDAGKSDIS